MFDLKKIQSCIKGSEIDGWLLYDFRHSNQLACRLLDIPPTQMLTRRFFYWIPKSGDPVKIISSVENPLTHLPGKEKSVHSWQELHQALKETLNKSKLIAMEYSKNGMTPEISRVDGGTIELVRSFGVEVTSSGDFFQQLMCVWDFAKLNSHLYAMKTLENTFHTTWNWIKESLNQNRKITEFDVQQKMVKLIEEANCVTEHPPICAINQNSSNPHYSPTAESAKQLRKGDWILLDLWCKENKPRAVYADITQVGVAQEKPTARQQEIFSIVKLAQDKAVEFIQERFKAGAPIKGFEVDQLTRNIISKAGYGPYFVHRTGHNIDESDHGPGAHVDDLETHEERELLPGTCFSIEPGIYLLKEFGVRLEFDVYLDPKSGVKITGGKQEKIYTF